MALELLVCAPPYRHVSVLHARGRGAAPPPYEPLFMDQQSDNFCSDFRKIHLEAAGRLLKKPEATAEMHSFAALAPPTKKNEINVIKQRASPAPIQPF